ncbi:hypothetical protein Bbelb_172380 [Branchiostoma belcheri]|nr:hypothetical protein Bbelb_172380 [Branchiostoma belcheri]
MGEFGERPPLRLRIICRCSKDGTAGSVIPVMGHTTDKNISRYSGLITGCSCPWDTQEMHSGTNPPTTSVTPQQRSANKRHVRKVHQVHRANAFKRTQRRRLYHKWAVSAANTVEVAARGDNKDKGMPLPL